MDDFVAGAVIHVGDQSRSGERQRRVTEISTLGDNFPHADRHGDVVERKGAVNEEGADSHYLPSVCRVLQHDALVLAMLDVPPVPFDAFDALAYVVLVKYQQIVLHERHHEEAQWPDHSDLIVHLLHLYDQKQAARHEHECDQCEANDIDQPGNVFPCYRFTGIRPSTDRY